LARVWGRIQPLEVIGGLGAKPSTAGGWGSGGKALGNFCNFLIKITHFYAYFVKNRYFKAITDQLKAFEKQSKRTK